MSRIAALGLDSRNMVGRRQKTVAREIVIGPNAIRFIAILICAILAIVYLTQSTAGANRSVEVGKLADKETELKQAEEQLRMEQTRLESLREIEGSVEKNVLEPTTEVGHLSGN